MSERVNERVQTLKFKPAQGGNDLSGDVGGEAFWPRNSAVICFPPPCNRVILTLSLFSAFRFLLFFLPLLFSISPSP
jgi:hypothetical protein